MQFAAVLIVTLSVAAFLAGCGAKTEPPTAATGTCTDCLSNGKGAITGVVIDDRYRPVPDALVVLTPSGLTAKSDAEGQFQFGPLEPGSYVVLAQAKDHEAAPKNADVKAGEYTELEVQARRTFNQNGLIITTQFSIFIDCSEEAVVIANEGATEGVSCMMDQSGDSARGSFDSQLSPADANLTTYMVTEAISNQKGSYSLVVGTLDAQGNVNKEYADATCIDGTYARVQMQPKKADTRPGEQENGATAKWPAADKFTTIIFPRSNTYQQVHDQTGLWGAGVVLGFKAKIVQTVFLGPPGLDIGSYAVLKPAS